MDSIVGYKTERYLKFRWCGARTDDVMQWIPARLTWILLFAILVAITGLAGATLGIAIIALMCYRLNLRCL